MRFPSNFGCKIIFMPSVNFWHQQESNPFFKGSIGHVTSLCEWPIVNLRRFLNSVLREKGKQNYQG